MASVSFAVAWVMAKLIRFFIYSKHLKMFLLFSFHFRSFWPDCFVLSPKMFYFGYKKL